MKYFIMSAAVSVCCFGTVSAQFTIKPQNENASMNRNDMLSDIQRKELDKDYFDRAFYEAERRRLKHERNTINFKSSLETSLQQFENWTSSGGGQNNYAFVARLDFTHTYKKDKYNVFYKAKANYGLNYIEKIKFKSTDDFEVSGNTGWNINDNLAYTANFGLKSQFGPKYKSRTDKTLISDFMSPGEFNVGLGFSYAKPKSPLRINFSPINGKVVTVLNKELRDNSKTNKFGEVGKKVNSSLGIRLEVFYNKSFGKKKNFSYDTKFNLTNAYKDMWNATTNWENTLRYQFTRYLALSFSGKMLYDYNRAVKIEERNRKIQYQYLLTVGFTMNYKNK